MGGGGDGPLGGMAGMEPHHINGSLGTITSVQARCILSQFCWLNQHEWTHFFLNIFFVSQGQAIWIASPRSEKSAGVRICRSVLLGDLCTLFPQNSPGNLSMNNQPGTPREDGEMGGNFLNPFQSESVSRISNAPPSPRICGWVHSDASPVSRSSVSPQYSPNMTMSVWRLLRHEVAPWNGRAGLRKTQRDWMWRHSLPVTLRPPLPPAESGHLPPRLCTTAPIPHRTHPQPLSWLSTSLLSNSSSHLKRSPISSYLTTTRLYDGPRLKPCYEENSVYLHTACRKL